MALFIKRHWSRGAKILGAVVFALLLFFNLQISTSQSKQGDIDLLGVKVSLNIPSTYAEGGDCTETDSYCYSHTICVDGNCETFYYFHNFYT
jgi:hypothetical protein